jgi:natural product precursor
MKPKKETREKKLKLSRETIKNLQDHELAKVVGGGHPVRTTACIPTHHCH